MSNLSFGAACFAALGLAAGAAQAQSVSVTDAWIRPPPPGAPTAAAYANVSTKAGEDRLIGGSSPRAHAVELHEMSMAGGVMRMRPLTAGAPIAAGRPLRLEPGGMHLMLISPSPPLRLGERVPVTLKFARSAPVRVDFVVGGPPAARP